MMSYKHSIFAVATGAAMVLACGCGKQEPTPASSGEKAAKSSAASVPAGEKQESTPTTRPAGQQRSESSNVLAGSAVSSPASAPEITPSVASSAVSIAAVSTATNSVAAAGDTAQLSPASTSMAATNSVQSAAVAATNQGLEVLGLTNGLSASNQISAALGTTNVLAATNQVEVLLARARTLTTNQQYQAALATITQLYSTKLTPDQKQQVDKLKTQAEASLAKAATNQFQSTTNRVLAALGMTNSISTTATNQVEALLERARVLTTNQQYQAALGTVSQLYSTKLTPEQKQKVDDLKNQLQATLADKAAAEASSALGNFLGGKSK